MVLLKKREVIMVEEFLVVVVYVPQIDPTIAFPTEQIYVMTLEETISPTRR